MNNYANFCNISCFAFLISSEILFCVSKWLFLLRVELDQISITNRIIIIQFINKSINFIKSTFLRVYTDTDTLSIRMGKTIYG